MNEEREDEILQGYRHLAFADVRDPVRLLFCDEITPNLLKKLDLSSIAEIKRPKGGMEIKFYDKLRALEGMSRLYQDRSESDCGIFEALERGSEALRGGDA